MPLTDCEKKTIVNSLISESKVGDVAPWTEEDRMALNAMPESKLLNLEAYRKATTAKVEPPVVEKPPVVEPTANCSKVQTEDEWLAAAPAGIQTVVRNAMAFEQQQVANSIAVIVADPSNKLTENQLKSLDVSILHTLADSARAKAQEAMSAAVQPRAYYGGASVPAVNTQKPERELLPLPVLSFEKKTS